MLLGKQLSENASVAEPNEKVRGYLPDYSARRLRLFRKCRLQGLTLTTGNQRLADSNPSFASQIVKMDFRQGSPTVERTNRSPMKILLAACKI
uniref:Uncharacterized protein n=1 Tax=Vespula pensylvanica TaxID=30213 RepID=A0A834JWX3_VESPE|nr:hypothetical protein H0235_017004 [Vespula pensylvanica]